jgi:pimeloyl-ACP methyl ester carboxylesterase
LPAALLDGMRPAKPAREGHRRARGRHRHPDLVLEFRKALPSDTLVTFEESGHLPFVEEPDRYVELLRNIVGAEQPR